MANSQLCQTAINLTILNIDLGLNQNAFEGAATLTSMTEYVEIYKT